MLKMIELFLRNGKDVDGVDSKVWTALLVAALTGEEAVRFLRGEVADGKRRTAEGDNSLQTAVLGGSLKMTKALLKNEESIEEVSGEGKRALQFSTYNPMKKVGAF